MGVVVVIDLILQLVERGVPALTKIIGVLQQAGELTDEEAAAFRARIEAHAKSDAAKTDKELGL